MSHNSEPTRQMTDPPPYTPPHNAGKPNIAYPPMLPLQEEIRLDPPQLPPATRVEQRSAQKTEAQLGQEYRDRLLAQCAQGKHDPTTNYGVGGIIAAVLCFPFGLICLCIDTETKCSRCGVVMAS